MHVWVPVKGRDDLTHQLITDFQAQRGNHRLTILNNGDTHPNWDDQTPCPGVTIHQMWNHALEHTSPLDNICLINNDVRIHTPTTFDTLDATLQQHPDIGLVSPNHGHPDHKTAGGAIQVPPTIAQHGGPAGFCFAIPPRTHHQYRFPHYRWWYGDTDLFFTVHHLHGRALAVHTDVLIEHVDGGSQTPNPTRDADIDHDRQLFDKRWGPRNAA